MHRLQELVRLHRMGTGFRKVATLLHMSPNTEREYRIALKKAGLLLGPVDALPELSELHAAVVMEKPGGRPAHEQSSVLAWSAEIEGMLSKGAGPTSIHDALRLEHKDEYAGSLSAIKRYCLAWKRSQPVAAEDVRIPVQTAPGEVAQVDFGYVGKLYDPDRRVLRKAWVFVMSLGYSRHMFATLVFDQKVETWLRCHIEAFAYFGGVPEVVVPDNLKAAVVRAAFAVDDMTSGLNRSYRELARHYGFRIDPAPPYSPQKKGKVESAVKYIKHNFFKPRDIEDFELAQAGLALWLHEVAAQRTHGTTGRKPIEAFEQDEKSALLKLPAHRFELVEWKECTVHPDAHISFAKRLYSVPWTLIGEKVWVRATPHSVVVFAKDERVATHDRRGPGSHSTFDAHLPVHREPWRHRGRSYWLEQASHIGPETRTYIEEVFDSDEVASQLRVVQSMVTHLKTFPRERAEAACKRARYFGNHRFQGLRDILRKALDFEPLFDEGPDASTWSAPPRFARSASDIIHPTKETSNDLQ